MRTTVVIILMAGLALSGCSSNQCDTAKPTFCGAGKLYKLVNGAASCVAGCLPDDATTCTSGQACEAVEGSDPRCFAQLQIQGKVVKASDAAGIEGVRVAARDDGGAVMGKVALSGADGSYTLPVAAKRKADGTPATAMITLRADAAGYASFPGGVRPALPLDLAGATKPASTFVLSNFATTIALIPVANPATLGTIRGKVDAPSPAGTLVVAAGVSGVADTTGEFAVFNVPAGAATVRGYNAGLQLTPKDVTVVAGGEVKDGVLSAATTALATVTGSGGNSTTSVALAVEETFVAVLEIGEVPRGLRASGVSNSFSIAGVPDGKYVILASLDNDGLVRDPDPHIAGTQIVHLTVTGGVPSATGSSFKVTGALAVHSPGADAPEEITGTPTFKWADDSSEDGYEVFDAFGNTAWEKLDVPSVSGGGEVSVAYAGPALAPGMFYQFRATSMKKGAPISRTEELRGVFSALRSGGHLRPGHPGGGMVTHRRVALPQRLRDGPDLRVACQAVLQERRLAGKGRSKKHASHACPA